MWVVKSHGILKHRYLYRHTYYTCDKVIRCQSSDEVFQGFLFPSEDVDVADDKIAYDTKHH
jgi:hypothetical protein